MEIKGCPVCGNKDMRTFVEFNDFPEFQFPVTESFISHIGFVHLRLFFCSNCGHITQRNFDEAVLDKIYGEFYRFYNLSSSEQMSSMYLNRFTDFFSRLPNKQSNKRLFEIGCGKAAQGSFYVERGFSYYGVDPSEDIELAIKSNPSGSFCKSMFKKGIFDVKFSIILSRFALEHVTDLFSFFDCVISYAEKGTILVIEVPDAMYYVDHGLHFFYSYEHISYFNSAGLKTLFEKFGFEVLESMCGDRPSILLAGRYVGKDVVVKDRKEEFKAVVSKESKFQRLSGIIESEVRDVFKNRPNICFYGAGLSYYWVRTSCIGSKRVFVIFDDNSFYDKKLTPCFKDRVKIPSSDQISSYDSIFLSANPPYYGKIKERIIALHKGRCEIIYLLEGKLLIEKIG